MKKSNLWRIIGSSLIMLIGVALFFFTMDPFKDYSIIFMALGAVGLIKLINNIILKYILFVIILCTTIIILLVV